MIKTIKSNAILEPNYTITIAPMEEVCNWFKMYTQSFASLKAIQRSYEKREKLRINDQWMRTWMEAIKFFGPTSKKARIISAHNKVPMVGLEEIAKAIFGDGHTLNANYIAVGSGGTAPSSSDTQLQAEFVRGTFQNTSRTDNVVYLDKFFGSAEVGSQTILECGVFMGATGAANSGVLLSRVNFNEVTTANETLSVNVSITINSTT